MYLLICKKNDINAYISRLYTVSPLSLGYSNQLIQSVSRPDGGPAPRNNHNTSWMSAETMSTRWQIPVKTSLMAPAQILSKDYENQTSPLHRPFLPASPTGMMFLQAEEVGWNILNDINPQSDLWCSLE